MDRHLEKFQKVLGETHTPVLVLLTCVSDVATEIKSSLLTEENLSFKDGFVPILECDSTECYIWALSILTSA
jgi:hypothetical protein